MQYAERIKNAILNKDSVLVVGLDPNITYFPSFMEQETNIINKLFTFNQIIIDAVSAHCVAIKPQFAYYEVFGSAGIKALEKTIAYAKEKGLLVINDAKRGDIGTTCEAYAEAMLGTGPLAADAVTVNPYLGRDGILPFIKKANETNTGIFMLVKTSNPSSGDLQDLLTKDGEPIYVKVARLANELTAETKGYSNIGVVVGATYPEEAELIREILPKSYFLVPGYGAQGASGKDLQQYYDAKGLGALVSSSRGITYPHIFLKEEIKDMTKEEFIVLVKEAVRKANKDINAYRK